MTKKIVIFIQKYLHDYKNSHIFVLKDDEERHNGTTAQRRNGATAQRRNGKKEDGLDSKRETRNPKHLASEALAKKARNIAN
jgi:hypothetical protein